MYVPRATPSPSGSWWLVRDVVVRPTRSAREPGGGLPLALGHLVEEAEDQLELLVGVAGPQLVERVEPVGEQRRQARHHALAVHLDQDAAAVAGVRQPAREPLALEPVDQPRHR